MYSGSELELLPKVTASRASALLDKLTTRDITRRSKGEAIIDFVSQFRRNTLEDCRCWRGVGHSVVALSFVVGAQIIIARTECYVGVVVSQAKSCLG